MAASKTDDRERISREVDDDTEAAGPGVFWRSPGARAAFRSALWVARWELGLSRDAALAVLGNVLMAGFNERDARD